MTAPSLLDELEGVVRLAEKATPGPFVVDEYCDVTANGEDVARIMKSQDELGHGQGIVVANPIPREQQWDPAEHDRVLTEALAAADAAGIHGKAVTPFLLSHIVDASGGRSLEVNLDLARNNERLAAEIAGAWSALTA